MIRDARDGTPLRLLPWTTPECAPCYLSTDDPHSRLSCLADELDRASVLPKGRVADDTVRMGSRLEYRDETLGTVRTATLVYPDEADISQGKISVLTPVGIALIGLKAGHPARPDSGSRQKIAG